MMPLNELLLPEFDHEMANTRLVLERLPEDKFAWAPHAKSFTLHALAAHVVNLPAWGKVTLTQDSLDLQPEDMARQLADVPATRAELLAAFATNVAVLRLLLAVTTDDAFGQPWSLSLNGTTLFTLPRFAVFRAMVLNHLIHHRAQLTVYLRLCDVPVPGLYGPTADEQALG